MSGDSGEGGAREGWEGEKEGKGRGGEGSRGKGR